VKRVLPFYIPKPKDELRAIWTNQKTVACDHFETAVPDDERVEDAGLDHVEDEGGEDQSPTKERIAA
jgi:hypothetical protein